MAKPRELFNTPAPQAIALMGQGMADAYANVGKIQGEGYAALGQGLAQGITAIGGAIGSYKQMSSQVKSAEGFYKSMKEGGYLPENLSKGIDATVGSEAYKHMGTAEKADFWGNVKSFTGNAISNQAAMDKMKAEFGYDIAKQGNQAYNQAGLYGVQAMLGNRSYPASAAGAGMPSMMPSAVPYGSQPVSNGTTFDPRKLDIRMGGSWQ